MRVALISTYELGRQPIHLASPAALLRGHGHEVRTLDLAVEPWDEDLVAWAEAIAFSTPMHTALRLATAAADRVRAGRTGVQLAAYGLYASVAGTEGPFDRAIAGEYERQLLEWVGSIEEGIPSTGNTTYRGRSAFQVPDRSGLPGLARYARLQCGPDSALVGSVEASHGCRHQCLHCPLPTVYSGRFRAVPAATVLADIERLVEAGAGHITFGDADFFNGPRHSLRIATEMHRRWPHLTYDATIKVEHLRQYECDLPTLVETGCLFVVSAFEVMNDRILSILDKGHTAADASLVVHASRGIGFEVRPTWLPFTPWTSIEDVADIFSFVVSHDLVDLTDPVQLSIRLLVPRGSLLAEHPAFLPYRGDYDTARATYRWQSPDRRVDTLADELAALAEEGTHLPPSTTFARMWRSTLLAGDRDPRPADSIPQGATVGRPRLTEPWFC
ncbi:MAG: CUAEP/CCAEP-tail radical SAM protein [bacterium]|nr:CUAEP/CCAEP-tail radical SAM protein [bacterium]MDE0290185.1 CUAEP/CCAEP-tail radical SAM protein [bacterium]MDE0440014.1 CUAEP/CCAEP-tail radical SAM protein [bacterium]